MLGQKQRLESASFSVAVTSVIITLTSYTSVLIYEGVLLNLSNHISFICKLSTYLQI